MKPNRTHPVAVSLAALSAYFIGRSLVRRRRRVNFADKVVLITGGSRGLGLILARQLAEQGARLVLCSRKGDELARARQYLELWRDEVDTFVCDVADRSQVDELVARVLERHGRIDVLVNNASIIQVGPVEAMDHKDFRDAMNVNFFGTLNTTLAVLPSMRERGFGRILNVTSIGGVVSVPHLLPYVSAKSAAVGFSKGIFLESARHGVRVTTIVPGLMRTGSFLNALFKGRRSREVNWFSLGASLPGVSMSAERAAQRMIAACRDGVPFVTVGLAAKTIRLIEHLMTNATLEAGALVNHFVLPEPGTLPGEGPEGAAEPGYEHRHGLAASPLTLLGDLAAREYHEKDRTA